MWYVFILDRYVKHLYFIEEFYWGLRICQDIHEAPGYNEMEIIPWRIHSGKTDTETDHYNTIIQC